MSKKSQHGCVRWALREHLSTMYHILICMERRGGTNTPFFIPLFLQIYIILQHRCHLCLLMSSYVILHQVMSSCDVPFTTSNISYTLEQPTMDSARLSNFSETDGMTHSLPIAITIGAFATKNQINRQPNKSYFRFASPDSMGSHLLYIP